jgi:hypothetical protein
MYSFIVSIWLRMLGWAVMRTIPKGRESYVTLEALLGYYVVEKGNVPDTVGSEIGFPPNTL